jgi:alanine racemase
MIKAEINTKTIINNIKAQKRKLGKRTRFCAVLKANAYRFGDVEIARAIDPHVDWFAVATINEATRLRLLAKTAKPILLLGVCEDFKTAIANNITITITCVREMRELIKISSQENKIFIHIAVNTGMNRYGITTLWQLKSILDMADKNPNINVGGIYTHFSHEMDNITEIDAQLARFAPYRTMLKSKHPRAIVHAACAGSADHAPAQFDMVRIGKSLYGGYHGYQTALTITSKITAIQNLQRGSRVGYGGTFTTTQPTTIGIVPCGYADFANLGLSNKGTVIVDKTPCNIVGRITMDTIAIDITHIKNPINKIVTIISNDEGQTLMDLTRMAGLASAAQLMLNFNFTRSKLTYKN